MQGGGLIHETSSGDYHIANAYTTSGASDPNSASGGNAATGSATGGGVDVGVDVTGSVDSHLDSFFATHAVTRDDVLVLAGVLNVALFLTLLYVEVAR